MRDSYSFAPEITIIGAGWAGLYAAKYAQEAGLSFTILEERDDLGGVWNFSDDPHRISVMQNTVSSTSRIVTEASDFPMDPENGNFFDHDDALQYLKRYSDFFGLTQHIVTNAKVISADKRDAQWWTRTEDGRIFKSTRIAICSGVHRSQRPMTGPIENFTGTKTHAGSIKRTSDLCIESTDHVIVYGGGETASDIVNDLSIQTEAKITWAIRGGQHFWRKTPYRSGRDAGKFDQHDIALDEFSSAFIDWISPFQKSTPGMRYRSTLASTGSVFTFQGHGIEDWRNDHGWYRHFINKNGHVLDHVWSERVTPANGIESCDGDVITFENGRTVAATHIICAFGYLPDFSFLPDDLSKTPTDKLYNLVFHPDDPSVSYFGFARPTILSLPYLVELQCFYAKKVWAGDLELLDGEARVAEVACASRAMESRFGYDRANKKIICPFLFTNEILKVVGKVKKVEDIAFARFSPLRDWLGFSRILRVSVSPFLLRLLVEDIGLRERKRLDHYAFPMPIGLKRNSNVTLLRYIFSYIALFGIPRMLRIDDIIDWLAVRTMKNHGRAGAARRSKSAQRQRDTRTTADGSMPSSKLKTVSARTRALPCAPHSIRNARVKRRLD